MALHEGTMFTYLVGVVDIVELLLSVGIVGVLVRVVLHGQLPVRFLYLARTRLASYPQNVVKISPTQRENRFSDRHFLENELNAHGDVVP